MPLIGDSYWTTPEIAALPEFIFPGSRARRQFQMLQSAYDQADAQSLADAMFQKGIIEYRYPKLLERFRDQMAGRGMYLSGLTTKGEGELAEQRLFDIGAVERQLANALAQSRIARAMGGIGYSDSLENALLGALSADQAATFRALMGGF